MSVIICAQVWRYLNGYLKAPGRADRLVTTPSAPVGGGGSGGGGGGTGGGTSTPFVLGVTQAFVVDSDNPGTSTADNVGANVNTAIDGTLTVSPLTGVVTIGVGQKIANKRINGVVRIQGDNNSELHNCIVTGITPASSSYPGLVVVTNGGKVTNCTLRTAPNAQGFYLNGVNITGPGVTKVTNCDISHVVDSVHVNGGDHVEVLGNYMHHYSLFTNDPTHMQSTEPHPGWGHADVGIQRLSVGSGTDLVVGNNIQAFFDTEGVTWAGGAPGSGIASGGIWGYQAYLALNQGYVNVNPASENYGLGTYANAISYTNVSGHKASVHHNWVNGVSAPSSLIQFTVSPNTVDLYGNRFGLGGEPTSLGKFYLVTPAPATTTGDPNIFFTADDRYAADVKASLRGTTVPATFRITP